jgi:hypothetical protein
VNGDTPDEITRDDAMEVRDRIRIPEPALEVYARSTPLSSRVFGRQRGGVKSVNSCDFPRPGTTDGDTLSTLVMKGSAVRIRASASKNGSHVGGLLHAKDVGRIRELRQAGADEPADPLAPCACTWRTVRGSRAAARASRSRTSGLATSRPTSGFTARARADQ